jgi:hypothetical protein
MIYAKTERGQAALLSRSLSLTPRQRSAFIQFDGKRSLKEVLKATEGLGITQEDVSHMVAQGLLAAVAASVPVHVPPSSAARPRAAPAPAAVEAPSQNAQAHYAKAYPIATRLTAGLGLRGFLLNLAVEGATDLDKLKELAPKIMKAVGPEKFRELNSALYD